MLILSLLIMIIRGLCALRTSPAGYKRDDAPSTAFRCFSCMSRHYGSAWKFFGYNRIYMEPRSFTDDCQDPTVRGSDVPYTICPDDANCVTLVEDIQLGVGAKGYIRGCWGSIFLYGFNRTGRAGKLAHSQMCDNFSLNMLVGGGRPIGTNINVCSCNGSLCNGAINYHSLSISTIPLLLLSIIILINS